MLAKRKLQPVYLLMLFSMVLMVVIGAFFEEGVAFFDPVYNTIMSNFEYSLTLVAVVLSVAFFLFLAHRYYKIKQNWVILVLAIILCGCNIVAELIFPAVLYTRGGVNGFTYPVIYYLNDDWRIRFMITFAVTCVYLYLMLVYVPQILRSSKELTIFLYAAIGVGIAGIIYSLIVEWDRYVLFFTPGSTPTGSDVVESFFMNRNTYGTMLLLGMYACCYLHNQSRHFWYYILIVLFGLQLLFVLSKTCIFLSLFMIYSFLLYRFIVTVRRHPVKDIIWAVLIIGFSVTFVALVLTHVIDTIPVVGKAWKIIYKALFEDEASTFKSRVEIWKYIWKQIDNPLQRTFGMGDGNYMWLLGQCLEGNLHKLGYPHNGFVAMYGYGGFVRLGLYLAMLLYFFVVAIKNIKHKRDNTWAPLLGFVVFIGHSMVETTSFMGADAKSITLLLVIFAPVLSENYAYKHETEVEERSIYASDQVRRAPIGFNTNSYLIGSILLSALCCGLVFAFYGSYSQRFDLVSVINAVILFVSSVVFVGICSNKLWSRRKGGRIALHLFMYILTIFAYFVPAFFNDDMMLPVTTVTIGLWLILAVALPKNNVSKADKKAWIFAMTSSLLVLGVCFGYGQLIKALPYENTRYARMCHAAIILLAFVFTFFGTPLSTKAFEVVETNWFRLENKHLLRCVKWEEKLVDKRVAYRTKKSKAGA